MEVLRVDRQAQLDLATRALNGQSIGGKPPTENHKKMAELMCVRQEGKGKQIELLPEGAYTVLQLNEAKTPNEFFDNNAIILNSSVDLMGRPVFVGADAVDGTFLLRAKQVTDNIGKLMAPVVGSNTNSEKATQELARLLKEGRVEQIMFDEVVKSARVASAKGVVERGGRDPESGLFRDEKLQVLKTFFSGIIVDTDFKHVVPGAGDYNRFSRTPEELDTQIERITERHKEETDPKIKYCTKVQLEIIQKFRDRRNELDKEFEGVEWNKILEDKRTPLNIGPVKFKVRSSYIQESADKVMQEKRKLDAKLKGGEYKVDELEQEIIDYHVEIATNTYLTQAKFADGLKAIRG